MTIDYVSISVVIVGWVIVHFLSRNRDLKKEARSFALETVEYITAIEDNAIRYHANASRDVNKEHEIKIKLADLDSRISVPKRSLHFKHDISFFRSAITLNNFGSHHSSQDYTSEIVKDISYHATILREALYKSSLEQKDRIFDL